LPNYFSVDEETIKRIEAREKKERRRTKEER
jgi:hypothetical protein